MSNNDFFNEIEHTPVPWREYQLHTPVFYRDFAFMSVAMLAPLKIIQSALPSKRLKPYRVTPWHSTLTITAYQYKECDIGPYNEVSVSIPVTIDKETPVFTGSLRAVPEIPSILITHMPVSTEFARLVGAEFAGYPKFVADIDFSEEGDWLICELKAGGQNIITMSGRKLDMKEYPRSCINTLTFRNDYLLRSQLVVCERDMCDSKNSSDVKFELGNHQMAEELRKLKIGKVVGYRYSPQAKAVLTPAFESFAV